jgi:hypothetical protein
MQSARYFIVQDRNQWLIKYNDEEYGPYLTQAEATLFAVDAARKLSDRGEDAAVYLMGDNGRCRREWACGQDA